MLEIPESDRRRLADILTGDPDSLVIRVSSFATLAAFYDARTEDPGAKTASLDQVVIIDGREYRAGTAAGIVFAYATGENKPPGRPQSDGIEAGRIE